MEMTARDTLADPKSVMQENLSFLREYAKRLLLEEDDTLATIEDFKDVLMQELLAVGRALRLTERDLAVLLFRGILDQ